MKYIRQLKGHETGVQVKLTRLVTLYSKHRLFGMSITNVLYLQYIAINDTTVSILMTCDLLNKSQHASC